MTRVAWSALIVLMLEALPTDAFARSPVCHVIRRGESAAQAARRTTGNGRNAYQAWFQIMNASSRFVPKSQYDRIHAGWRACVVPAIRNLSSTANQFEEREAANVSTPPNGSGVPKLLAAPHGTRERRRRRCRRRSTAVPQPPTSFEGSAVSISRCCGLCAAVVVLWLGWRIVDDYLARRKTASIVVRYFVDRFVDEFERPLVRYDAQERPVRSLLRCGARREAIRHSSRAGRGKALSEPVGPQEERRIRRGPGDARARR